MATARLSHWLETGQSAMLAKFRKLTGSAVDGGDAISDKDVASTRLIPGQSNGEQQSVVIVLLLGLDEETMQEIIVQTRPKNKMAPKPVFVIDTLDFDIFTAAGEVFEYVPSNAAQKKLASPMPWDRYLESRLELLAAKWQPISIIPFGGQSREMLTFWEAERAARLRRTEEQRDN